MSLSLSLAIAAARRHRRWCLRRPVVDVHWPGGCWPIAGLARLCLRLAAAAHMGAARWRSSALTAACACSAAAAHDAALHPPLRTLLEQRLGGFAIEGIDAARHDTPIVVEGRLLADAAVDRERRAAATAGRARVARTVPRAGAGRRLADGDRRAGRRGRGRVAGRTPHQGAGAAAPAGPLSQRRRARPGAPAGPARHRRWSARSRARRWWR